MTSKNILEDYMAERMEEWAEWYSKNQNNGLGYPEKNILAKLQDDGGVLNRNAHPTFLLSHAPAEEIQRLLQGIIKQDPLRGRALSIRYLYPKEHEEKAKLEGYTRSKYYSHLRLAHEWMKGYLSAKKKIY